MTKETKCCKLCGEEKPITEFYKYHTAKYEVYNPYCKPCHKIKNKEYDEGHPEKAKLRRRRASLRFNHKLSLEDYEEMLNSQNFVCAICGESEITNHPLVVDHCHKTGTIRGLLCHNCNRAIGLLKDKITNLNNAITYLTKER